MADGFVCRGFLSTTIRTLFKEAIKCVHLGNDCYPGFLRILISVDAFITHNASKRIFMYICNVSLDDQKDVYHRSIHQTVGP